MAIPTRVERGACINLSTINLMAGGGINYIIETPLGINYLFFVDSNSDPAFIKSVDFGVSWSGVTVLKNITCTQLSVWYQRWTDPTGVLGDKIWCCYTDSGVDDIFIRSVDTANSDALGTEYTVFSGASYVDAAALSICQMRGGNLMCVGMIDAGTELFCRRSVDSGANWTNRAAVMEAAADQIIMMPGWGVDTQDGMAFYYDNSANEISVKYYDDSADSWAETSLATSITFLGVVTSLGQWSAAVDFGNSQNILVFWTVSDAANADLRCIKVTQSTQTEVTNVILNSVDDQGLAQISISGSDWYVFYTGNSDGTETFNSVVKIYYKKSTDNGATWGSETVISNLFGTINGLFTKPIHYKTFGTMTYLPAGFNIYTYNIPLIIPHSTYQLGM